MFCMRGSRFSWLLDSREFTFLLSTRFLVTFGTQIAAVATGWLVYQIKKDPLYLGLIGLAEAFPALGLALFSGWIVDRGRPLTIYFRAVLCSALSSFLLWLLTAHILVVSADLMLGLIFFAAFMTGAARSFLGPSQFSILPLTVPREKLGHASAWNTSFFQIAALSGPGLGGLIYAVGGGSFTFFFVLILLAAAAITSRQIRVGNELRPPNPEKVPSRASFFSGVKFVFGHQVVLAALSLDMFGVLFGGATALFPIFAGEIFSNGPMGLGMLRAAMPVGSFLMGWFLIRVPISGFTGKIMLAGFCGFGLCMAAFGLSHSFYFSLILLLLAGMCDSISMVTRQTLLQLLTPMEMRGRVSSVNSIFIGSSNEIGAFESGLAAKLMGTRPSVVFGGCMTLIVVVVTWFMAPRLAETRLSDL
jgi:MFS family permease